MPANKHISNCRHAQCRSTQHLTQYTHTHTFMYLYIIHICICICIYMYIHTDMYIYMYIYMCIYMYIYALDILFIEESRSPDPRCNTLQHTATQYNTRYPFHRGQNQSRQLHAATHCLQYTATHCNTLQHTATHCNTLQHTATYCNTLQHSVPFS